MNAISIGSLARRFPFLLTGDQLLVSGSNFLTTVLVARALDQTGFGQFSAAWLGILLSSSLLMATIVFPAMTLAPVMGDQRSLRYMLGNLGVYLLGAALAVAVFASVALMLHANGQEEHAAIAIFGASAGALVLLQEYLRRFQLLRGRHDLLLVSDLLAFLGRVLLLVFCQIGDLSLNPATALGVVGLAAGAGCLAAWPWGCGVKSRIMRYAWKKNARAAKWLVPAGLMQWTTINSFLLAATWLAPITVIGQLRAVQNVGALTNPAVQLLENTVPTAASRLLAREGEAGLKRYTTWVLALSLAPAVLLTPLMVIFGGRLIEGIYGQAYSGLGPTLAVMWLVQMLAISAVPVRAALRSQGRERAWFNAYVLASVICIPCAYLVAGRGSLAISSGMLGASLMIVAIGSAYLFSGKHVNE